MFFGTYEHTLDEKNRLVIPRKMRDELGGKIYILKGFDGALSIYPETGFKKLVNELEKLSFNHKATRNYIRTELSSTNELDVDKLGRTIIPPYLMKKYALGKEVVVLGVGDHIEVWDNKTYQKYEENANKEFEENAETLDTKNV